MTEGQFGQKVNIREGDDLRYVVRNFNEMVESVNSVFSSDRDELKQILKSESLPDAEREKLQSFLEKLESRISDEEGKSQA